MPMTQAEVALLCQKTEPKLTSEDIAKQMEEFKANGGVIRECDIAETAVDFSKKAKPGETYGKRAY